MKKLLIAMTAAAVGTCAWAEEVAGDEGDSTPAAPTMLNETFGGDWTLKAPWSYWSGAETAIPADGELTAGDALSLNTGSKVLRGNFMSDGSAKDIDTGLYFNATVTFKDPSDTLPTLGAGDKFALVVLDNIESVDAGLATVNTTNLYVIANHGVDGKRAYQLSPAEGIVDLTENWLNTPQTISVKSYKDVLAGDAIRAGLLVKVGNYVCKVFMSYKINENNVIDFTNGYTDGAADKTTAAGYLGYAASDIEGSVRLRYTNQELMLAMVTDTTLASVDFQGQGVIDNVSLATTGDGFGTDSLALTVVADGVTLVDTDKTLYFAQIGDTVTIKFTVNEGFELSSPTGLTAVDGVYTYEYPTKANNEVVTISAFLPVATINGVKVSADEFATKFAAMTSGELVLSGDIDASIFGSELRDVYITAEQEITIDLNGNTIKNSNNEFATITNEGILTIIDSSEEKDGAVQDAGAGSIVNNGTLTITAGVYGAVTTAIGIDTDGDAISSAVTTVEGGTFNGAFTVETDEDETDEYTATASVTGGKFLKTANAEVAGVATGYAATDDGTYWVVAKASTSNYPESYKLVDSDTELDDAQKKAVEATFGAIAGEAADADAAVTNYINTVYGATVPVGNLIGAQSVDISVAFNLPLMKTAEPIVEIVAEAVGADDAAAFSFQIEDGKGNPVAIKAAVAKVYDMIRYATDLAGLDNGKVAAGNPDVECVVDEGNKKIKVNMKKTQTKGFMKVKLR